MELCIGEDKSKGKYQECILDIAVGSKADLKGEEILYQNPRTKAATSLVKVPTACMESLNISMIDDLAVRFPRLRL
jgi:hypothetical protein